MKKVVLNESMIQKMVKESVKNILREGYMQNSWHDYTRRESSKKTVNGSDLFDSVIDELNLSEEEYDEMFNDDNIQQIYHGTFNIKVSSEHSYSSGDYDNPGFSEYDEPEVVSDDGLMDLISGISDERYRNAFINAYNKIAEGEFDFNYDD